MKKLILLAFLCMPGWVMAQTQQPNPFDYGKMWTFEHPPVEWFKEAYGMDADQQWFDDVRKSSLRFATWCSASFISPDGLIMTNHHCSRDVVGDLQKEGENFDKQGFYAAGLADERKAEGLFVEQLIQVADISDRVLQAAKSAADEEEAEVKKQDAIEAIQNEYKSRAGWEGLRLQVVSYYSGARYSLYGYKRYDDIRLVWIPELDLGFFGGDPDNFTYPRYNLDVTFWRAYDENGIPLDTRAHFLPFNPNGASEGEAVFVVGNPGSTERYRTVAQLEYDRDYRYPMLYKFLKNRNDLMMAEYNEMVKDPAKEFEAQSLLNTIANIANGMKAFGGIADGLANEDLFGRKVAMEKYIRMKSPGVPYWDELEAEYEVLNPHAWAVSHLSPSGLRGSIYRMMHTIYQYESAVKNGASEEELADMRDRIAGMSGSLKDEKELTYFRTLLQEISEDIYPGDYTLVKVLEGLSIDDFVNKLSAQSKFTSAEETKKCLAMVDKLETQNDLIQKAARIFGKRYEQASSAFQSSSPRRKRLEAKIANQAFQVFGNALPPDATFTLRISDGVIKAYEYNGTVAPVNTTFYGLYDRYYSHKQVFPWSLPDRWLNPDPALLKAPFNTISTNDIIGGNSGSPLINKNKEAVGLIFDGNIESLPGNFIFDEEKNRTVSVHAGGIYAALKYIYGAERILKELDKR